MDILKVILLGTILVLWISGWLLNFKHFMCQILSFYCGLICYCSKGILNPSLFYFLFEYIISELVSETILTVRECKVKLFSKERPIGLVKYKWNIQAGPKSLRDINETIGKGQIRNVFLCYIVRKNTIERVFPAKKITWAF